MKAHGLQNLAWFYWRDRRPERIELFLKAIAFYEQVEILDVDPAEYYRFRHQLANTRSQVSRLMLSEKQYEDAIEQLTQALDIFDQLMLENPRDTAVMNDRVTTLIRLCSNYLESKQTDGFAERFPEWIAAAKALPENRLRARWTNWFRLRLGRHLAREHEDYDAAHAQLDQIIASAPNYLETYDIEIVILRDLTGAITSKAEWYMNAGQFDEAVEFATLGEKYNNLLLARYPNARLVAPATVNKGRAVFLARMQGLNLVDSGNLPAARKLILDKLELAPDAPRHQFVCARNLAKCAAFAEDSPHNSGGGKWESENVKTDDLALQHLTTAIEFGFDNLKKLEGDEAWNRLRETDRFQAIISGLQN